MEKVFGVGSGESVARVSLRRREAESEAESRRAEGGQSGMEPPKLRSRDRSRPPPAGRPADRQADWPAG